MLHIIQFNWPNQAKAGRILRRGLKGASKLNGAPWISRVVDDLASNEQRDDRFAITNASSWAPPQTVLEGHELSCFSGVSSFSWLMEAMKQERTQKKAN